MKSTFEALKEGFQFIPDDLIGGQTFTVLAGGTSATIFENGYYSFKFGENNEYELCFEPLIWEHQYNVALYKNENLLTEKVVVKPGYVKEDDL